MKRRSGALATSIIVGTLLLLGGNGCVVFAQHYIPSSLAALLVATEPLWIVVLGWLWLKGQAVKLESRTRTPPRIRRRLDAD
jgi:drug/metabolite transporter (DMT)-like permease